MQKINKSYVVLLIVIFLGLFYRFYQSNFDDYWFDEYFGFWISDSRLDFIETFERSFGPGKGQNLFFDFVTLSINIINFSNSNLVSEIKSSYLMI